MKKGKYVYKNKESMDTMYAFYDKALSSLNVDYEEVYIDTTYGKTHLLTIGDKNKTPIFTLHGGNGISPLNIRFFLPLLENHCIIAPDVIGMPGKSAPYRNLNTNKDDYGVWIHEIIEYLKLDKVSFIVSSYSCAMMLSLAKIKPERIDKVIFIVPSGIAHGAIFPMMSKMAIPFMKYYFKPSNKTLNTIIETMVSECDELWSEFFDLMMSSYKMEMRPPKEFSKNELVNFYSPILIFASNEDIFFPADKVFSKAKQLFNGSIKTYLIDGKHLPSNKTMKYICDKTAQFLEVQK